MRIGLIAHDFYPNQGGIAHVLNSFSKSFKSQEDQLFIFNRYHKGKNIFDVLYREKYDSKKLLLSLLDREFLLFFILSIWKLVFNRKRAIPFSHKIMILLYLILKPRFLFETIKNVQNLYPYFKKIEVDIILGGSSGMHTLPLIILLSMIFNVKVASIAYGNDFLVRTGLSLKSYYLSSLDLIFLGTNKMKKIIKKIHSILDPNKFVVVNYGLILDEYTIKESKTELREKFGVSMDDVILLSVGRHVPRKNFDLVIKAIKKIKEKHENLKMKYFLLGEGETTPKLKSLSKKLKLENDVKFLGYVDTLTRNYYYKMSDIFIMPSKIEKESIEGFGIVFLEANFYNLPVIGTYSGGITEAIIDGTTGFLIKPNNIDDLVGKIEYLYLNPGKKVDMGNKGHNRVISKFDWNSLVKNYIHYLNILFKSH